MAQLPRIWSFLNAKGGVGKTMLAVHAAVWHANKGRRVVVVDADAQASSSTWLAEAAPAGVACVTAADADQLRQRVEAAGSAADIVVVDGAAGLSSVTRQALVLSDLVVVPCGPSVLDLRAARQAVELVLAARQARGSTLPAARLVLNRVQLHTTLGAEALEAIRQQLVPACRAVIKQRTCLADAAGQASTVFAMGTAAAEAAADLSTLFRELDRCHAES
jgi:chromosome partitioning protein